MDCCDADDYCEIGESKNLPNLETQPCENADGMDQFVISFEVETTVPVADEDEESQFVRVDKTQSYTLWAPCPRFKKQNLSKERISSMLSRVGVPLHKQDFMIHLISFQADHIANAPRNKPSSILPLSVSISLVSCSCSH